MNTKTLSPRMVKVSVEALGRSGYASAQALGMTEVPDFSPLDMVNRGDFPPLQAAVGMSKRPNGGITDEYLKYVEMHNPGASGTIAKELDKLRHYTVKLEAQIEILKNPNAVHANMLTGRIAKPSWAQIKHLYPNEIMAELKIARTSATLRAIKRERKLSAKKPAGGEACGR
jgi:hypothetical protein